MDRYEQKRIFYADSKRGYSDIQLVPNPKGEWVKYSDVKALQSERNHLAVANETLQARVRELEEALAGKVKALDEMAERHTYGDVYERRSIERPPR